MLSGSARSMQEVFRVKGGARFMQDAILVSHARKG